MEGEASLSLRRVLLAYSVNELGTWFGYVALAVGVYDHTHSALAMASLFVAGRLVPAFVVPPLVARVELSGRRGALSGLYALEGLLALGLALLLWHFSLAAVLALVMVDGAAALASRALLRASVAHTGEAPGAGIQRRRAAAALNFVWTATAAAGAALAGLLVAAIGAPGAMLVDAGSFLACALLLIGLRPVAVGLERSVRSRMGSAWKYLRASPQLRFLLAVEAAALVFFASVEPVEVVYAKATLGSGDRGFGALMAAWGVGMVLGGAILHRARGASLRWLLGGGTLAVGAAYLGMAVAPDFAVAAVAAVVGGIGNGMQWGALITSVQELTPESLHGQLMGTVESMGAVCPSLGFLIGGVVVALTSARVAFALAGAMALAMGVLFVLARRGLARPSAEEWTSGAVA
jgi:MFS family permease